jgi:hypothetical protein
VNDSAKYLRVGPDCNDVIVGGVMHKICAISQPTFLPWLGWFDLADQSDLMVILDDVIFSKRSWQQRNRIRTRNGLEFLTVPVVSSGRYDQRIVDCELVDRWFVKKMIATLRANYAKAPFFAEAIEGFVNVMESAVTTNRLVELNCGLIAWMAGKLGVSTPIVRASDLGVAGQRGEHLAAICERLGFTHYLSAPGSEDYLVEDKAAFDRRGISVWIHVYEHPEYSQCFSPFIPYASALDLIFNAGPAALEVMRSGRRTARSLGKHSTSNSVEQ